MMLSFTSSRRALARSISSLSPTAMVEGLWIISMDTGDIYTSLPAMAMTEAADAASPSIFTVTRPA